MRYAPILILSVFALIVSCDEPTYDTWSLVRDPSGGPIFAAIHFSDAKYGWIVGDDGSIERTVNGGNRWARQSSGVTSKLLDVHFIDRKNGWACGENSTILKTEDGGELWSNISPVGSNADTYKQIKFADEELGWVITGSGEMLKSIDGGNSWQLKHNLKPLSSNLFVFDATTAYVYRRAIHRTFDGGESWDTLTVDIPDPYVPVEMFFLNENMGWLTTFVPKGGDFMSNHLVVYTNDGGLSWAQQKPFMGGYLAINYFVNAYVGWVAGADSVYKTIDGGENWNSEFSDDGRLEAREMIFIHEDLGWILSHGGEVFRYLGSGH
jgi:photosystem II stability/assembly factor-like uncharacterized protein